jgi:hypothetical protein
MLYSKRIAQGKGGHPDVSCARPVTVREGSTIGGQARSESERGAAVRSIGFPAPHRFRAAEKDIIGPENSKYT